MEKSLDILSPHSRPFAQTIVSAISYKMLTSLLGVRSSLFCCSSWPALVRTPLLPSRCSPPRCKASTLEMPCLVSDKSDCVLHSLLPDTEGLDVKLSIYHPYSGDIFWYIPVREGNIDRYCPLGWYLSIHSLGLTYLPI